MHKLSCKVQNYAWGKVGYNSVIAQLLSHTSESHIHEKHDETEDQIVRVAMSNNNESCCPSSQQPQQEQCNKINNDNNINSNHHMDDISHVPFAELWMGTHSCGPSSIVINTNNPMATTTIDDATLIHNNNNNNHSSPSHASSSDVRLMPLKDYIGHDLPFLFKILSVNQALSIQAHPNNTLAKQLHRDHPHHYRDGNHKPELCCALTPFEAMCAFRPLHETVNFVKCVPEFRNLFPSQVLRETEDDESSYRCLSKDKKKEKLKALFSAYICADESLVREQLQTLVKRLSNQSEKRSPEEELLLRLNRDYPGDIGCFAVYFLNVLTLQPGEALFLAPNEPHSYLYGECVEVMACSDNVVRAGLTPKFRDVSTLVDMLTYNDDSLESYMTYNLGRKINEATSLYKPPVPEFQLFRIQLKSNSTEFVAETASILILIEGSVSIDIELNQTSSSLTLMRGDIYLIEANAKLSISSAQHAHLFIASSNPNYDQN